MRGRFISGLTTGAMIGAAASLLVMPQMSYGTRRKVSRTSRRIVDRAGDWINDIKDYSR